MLKIIKKAIFPIMLSLLLALSPMTREIARANELAMALPVFGTLAQATTVGVAAVPIFMLAAAAVMTGVVVYQNREQLQMVGTYLKDKAIESGMNISDFVVGGSLVMTQALKDLLKANVESIPNTMTMNTPTAPSEPIPPYAMPVDGNTASIVLSMWGDISLWTFTLASASPIVWNGTTTISFADGVPAFKNKLSYTDYNNRWETMGIYGAESLTTLGVVNIASVVSSTFPIFDTDGNMVYSPSTGLEVPISDAKTNVPSATVNRTIDAMPVDNVITFNPDIPLTDIGINDIGTIATDTANAIPHDTTGGDVTVPLDYGLPTHVALDFQPLMNFGLTTKFPFSIPWDIKNSVSSMIATPTAPTFDIDMTSWLGGTHYIIDFSIFDKLARIVRWGLLIIFNIGLLIKTRSIIRG